MTIIRVLFISAVMLLCVTSHASAQFEQPLKWIITSEKVGESTYEIKATGTFSAPGWHIYESPQQIIYGDGIHPIGKPEITVSATDTVIIIQKVKAVSRKKTKATVSIKWQCCNDTVCIPPETIEQTINLQH